MALHDAARGPIWVEAGSRRSRWGDRELVATTFIDTTSRRSWANELLADFRQRFAMSWANSELPVFLVGVDGADRGRVVAANTALCDLLGVAEIEGRRLDAIVRPVDEHLDMTGLAGAMCDGRQAQAKVAMKSAANSVVVGLAAALNPAGRPLFLLGYALDEQPLVDAHERRRRDLAKADAIHSHSSDVVVVVDASGRFCYVGPSAPTVLGHDPSSLVDTSALALIHPDDHELALEALTNTAGRPGPAAPLGLRIRAGDGSWRSVEVAATNRADDAMVDGVVVTIRDRSLDDLSDAETEERERRYRRIVESASDGIAMVDAQHRIVYANGRMGEILGRPPSELVGRGPLEFVAADRADEVALHLARRRSGVDERYPFELVRPDGSLVQVLVASTPTMHDGVMTGAVVWLTDVTELERTRDELEVSERRLTALLGAVPDLIFRLGRGGRYLEYHCADPS
ncbi:MAG: PAS domain S-box protein, partial [Microthrixaceae bacterium]